MSLAFILLLGGIVVSAFIFFLSRQKTDASTIADVERVIESVPIASHGDGLVISQEHGKLIYANEPARRLLKVNGSRPHLEQFAKQAEPAENFLRLFAAESQTSFQLGTRWIEASSHRIPYGQEVRTLVVMRELAAGTSNPDLLDMNLAMSLINEIGETVNASMGLEQVLPAILTIIMRSVHSDAGEISLWNVDKQMLYQEGWVGDANYLIALEQVGRHYRPGEGISGWVAQHHKPVMLNSHDDLSGVHPKLVDENPYNSFIAVPLKLGDSFVGTLELAGKHAQNYTRGDLALLQAISKPVAGLIYNTQMYSQQVQRVDDLANLQQVVSSETNDETDTASVYAALNERVASLVSADMSGIFLHDVDRQGLVAEPPFHGLPEPLVRTLFIPLPEGSSQRDIWENQSYWISNDVSDEPLVDMLGLGPLVSVSGITNTVWLPLQISDQRIGVIVVSNKRTPGGFNQRDVQHLTVLASQASIVIENIRLYQREKRLDTELIGLQELTNAIGALSHETEFYGEITERISTLMDIQMCGILLYDAENKRLVSKLPFAGVDDDDVRDYFIDLIPNTVMEQLWEEESYWYINRVQSDALVFEAGLDRLAEQLGVEKTLLTVLQASGRKLGIVQVSNKRNGEDFNDNDARLLMVFATQTAAIIENARLFREAQRSAEQAQGLRRVAELAGSVITTQETFVPLLAEVSKLMNSEAVFVNILNQQTGSLVTYPRWVYGMELVEPIVQDIYAPGFENSPVSSHKPYIGNDVINDPQVLPGYKQIAERMNLHNGVLVPLVLGDRTLGEMGIANRPDAPYLQQDLEVLQVIAAQIASTLERLLLYEATGENLNRRIEELDAISIVSNELTTTLSLDSVLEVILEQAIKATKALDGTMALLLPPDQWRLPDVPEMSRRIGHEATMPQLVEIEVESITRGADTVLITDYEFSTMEPAPAEARSAVAAAVLYLDQVVGVLHLYHNIPSYFDDRAAAFLMTLAAKASLGYANSIRYEEQVERSDRLRRRVEQLNRIFELGHMFQSNADPVTILEGVAYSVQQSVGFDTILMALYDEETNMLQRVAHAGMPITAFDTTRDSGITLESLQKLLREDYLISESYFFPVEEVGHWYVENIGALSTEFDGNRTLNMAGRSAWRDGDMLIVTLHGTSGGLIGVMSLDRPFDNQRPDQTTVEVLEIFAHQASTMIENTRLLSSSKQNAEQEAQFNEILENISSSLDMQEIIRSIATGAREMVPFSYISVTIIDEDQQAFDVLNVTFTQDATFTMERDRRASLGHSALYRSFADAVEYAYDRQSSEINIYEDLRQRYAQGECFTLVLPLITGGQMMGVLYFGSDIADENILSENYMILRRVAQIVTSSVQNARLFDQAVRLQTLNQAVVESIEQGIIVLDNSGHVISTNNFMQDRYGWDAPEEIKGVDLFEYRPRLADFLADSLRMVLEQGEPQHQDTQKIEGLDEEIIISNFDLYPLRYGEAVRGAVLLVEDVTGRAMLEEAMRSRAEQLASLTDASTRITSSLERADVVQLAMAEMKSLINYDAMTLWRRNGSYMVLEGGTGLVNVDQADSEDDVRYLFGDYEMMRRVVDAQRSVSVGSAAEIVDTIPVHQHVESWMGVPLVNQGHVVGLMMLTSSYKDAFTGASDQNIAMAFASQVAIAEANADLFEQTFDRTNELGTLLEAATATSMTTDLNSVYRTIVELMFSALDMDDCAIMLWDEIDHEIEVQVDMNRNGDTARIMERGTKFDLSSYPAKLRALREREVVVITINDEDTPYQSELQELYDEGDSARMLVPLVVRERSIGLIQLEQITDSVITQQKVRLAQALGTQVAVAIENAQLSAEAAAHFEESMIINELSRSISSTLNLDDMVEVVRDQVPGVVNARELYVALYDPATEAITFPMAVSDGQTYEILPRKLGSDEVSFIIKHRRALSIGADTFSPDELRKSLGISNGEGNARSYMGVPLMAGDEVYGVLAVRDTVRTRAFTVNEQRILNIIGPQLGAAIQHARLFKQISSFADDLNQQVAERTSELEDERDRIDTLYQITSELARTLDMDRLMPRALGMVAKAVNANDGVIMQLDPFTDELYSRAVMNPHLLQENPDGEHAYHPAERIARWLIEEDEHVEMVEDLWEQDYWDKDAPGAQPWRSALAVLLETNEELHGVMVLLSQKPNAFVESHLRLMVAAANQVASSINNAELYKLIRDQAERLGALLRQEQEEAEKNKAILEGIADGVVLSDSEGKIILFNNAAERILQVPRDQAMGESLSQITGLYGDRVMDWTRSLQEATFSENDTFGEFIDERLEMNGRNVSVHLSPVYTGDKFLGTVSVFRDITREVEADRSKSQFVTNVSHEFRTPLTPMKGYIDLILMGAMGEVSDKQKDMLATVKRNVDRLTRLVDDVLEISNLDTGKRQLDVEDVDLIEIVQHALNNLRLQPRHQAREHNVVFTPDSDKFMIRGDKDKLLQVVHNIVDNAFNYTPPGGTIEIQIKPDEQADRAILSVRDTGVGIPQEFQNEVWQRFARHDDTALSLDVSGTGLGLPIVKELVELHGGDVWFVSEVGVGTTFFISLPIQHAEFMTRIMGTASNNRSN